jgi:hypothetical protein
MQPALVAAVDAPETERTVSAATNPHPSSAKMPIGNKARHWSLYHG